jgi:cathepsin B
MVFFLALSVWALPDNTHDENRLAAIAAINSRPDVLWTAGVNSRFAGQPLGAAKDLCGVKPGNKEHMRARVAKGELGFIARPAVTDGLAALPESFDAAEHWPHCAKVIADIRDQSACGCCWAFGAAEAASDRLCIATEGKVAVPLSAQETCFCAQDDGCDGGQLDEAWEYIQQNGLATGGQYNNTGPFGQEGLCAAFSLPHCHHHGPVGQDPFPAEGTKGCPQVQESPQCPSQCDAGAKSPYSNFDKDRYTFSGQVSMVDSDADTIAREIMERGPVEAAFTVYKDFENYKSGIYHVTSDETLGGHAIKIVGWGVENGVKYWKVQNSWNPYWGEKGYFRIRRGTDEAGIEDEVTCNDGSKWSGPGVPEAQIVV